LLSVLSVRSRQVPTNTGPVEETLFTIRCRVKNTVDKTGDKEILRVEKSFASLMELGDKVGSASGMAPFLRSFFDDFPIEKPEQRKVRFLLTLTEYRLSTTFSEFSLELSWTISHCIRLLNS
jgi:hypothetical protein